jgi:MGT family glycosyltransferase
VDLVKPMWDDAGLQADPDAGLYRCRYLDPCPPSLRSDRGVAETVAQPIRPEIPGDQQASLPRWLQQLGNRPTLYVSLGTVPFFNQPSRFQALLQELVKEDLELVVTVSELHEPAALGQLPPNVHVEQWLPLAPLLPRCDAILCHAGSGTTLAGLTAGLPLVLVPDGADQFINADSCQTAGVAHTLLSDEITPTAVRDAVRAVLGADSAERMAARRIAYEIAAMPAALDVVHDLEDLVAAKQTQRAAR